MKTLIVIKHEHKIIIKYSLKIHQQDPLQEQNMLFKV